MRVIKGPTCYYVSNLIDFNAAIKLFFINFFMQVFFQWSMVQAMWFVGYKSYPLTISWRCFILTLTSKDCFKVK